MNVRYLRAAADEYDAAAGWYEEHSPGAGDDFVRAIEAAEAWIATTARTWPQWPGAREGVRRYLVPGLPYSIAYELVADGIVILAIAHQRRRPHYWFGRRATDR